jgi:hypothetical protein
MTSRIKSRDPQKTRTGKTRIFGMTVAQLTELAGTTSKKKERAKISNRISVLTNRNKTQLSKTIDS